MNDMVALPCPPGCLVVPACEDPPHSTSLHQQQEGAFGPPNSSSGFVQPSLGSREGWDLKDVYGDPGEARCFSENCVVFQVDVGLVLARRQMTACRVAVPARAAVLSALRAEEELEKACSCASL
jgi:hypothetical protein